MTGGYRATGPTAHPRSGDESFDTTGVPGETVTLDVTPLLPLDSVTLNSVPITEGVGPGQYSIAGKTVTLHGDHAATTKGLRVVYRIKESQFVPPGGGSSTQDVNVVGDAVGLAREATLASVLGQLDITLSALLAGLQGAGSKDLSTVEADLEAILAQLDVALSTRASQVTLASVDTRLQTLVDQTDQVEALLTAGNANTDEIEAKLEDVKTKLDTLNTTLGTPRQENGHGSAPGSPTFVDVVASALPTGAATEATLAALRADTDGDEIVTVVIQNTANVDDVLQVLDASQFSAITIQVGDATGTFSADIRVEASDDQNTWAFIPGARIDVSESDILNDGVPAFFWAQFEDFVTPGTQPAIFPSVAQKMRIVVDSVTPGTGQVTLIATLHRRTGPLSIYTEALWQNWVATRLTRDLDGQTGHGGGTNSTIATSSYSRLWDGTSWRAHRTHSTGSDARPTLVDGAAIVDAVLRCFNGSTFDRLRSAGDNADAQAAATLGRLLAATRLFLFNGTTWDRARGDVAFGLDVDVTRSELPTGAATEATLVALAAEDFATQATLASVLTELQAVNADLDVALSTRASEATLATLAAKVPDQEGTWAYFAGTSGTRAITGRVLQITAIALEAAATITIAGGDTITLPYGGTDKVSSSITIHPKGNLVNPSITFTGTDAYFVEVVQ